MNNRGKTYLSLLPYVITAVVYIITLDVYAQDKSLEEVVVTGSHIKQRSGMDTPVPVTAVVSDELNLMASGNLIEAVSELPQFFENTRFNQPGGSLV